MCNLFCKCRKFVLVRELNLFTMTTRRFLLLLIVAALLVPHTFEITNQNYMDATFTRYSVIMLLLTLFYEYGSTLAGPYSTLSIMLPTSAPLLNILTLIVNISIIVILWGLIKGRVTKNVILYIITIVLCVQAFLVLVFFSIQLDAWASVLSIPLPIFPIISILIVLRNKIPIVSS